MMMPAPIATERRAAIVAAAKEEILHGSSSLAEIAEKHGIARRTLQYWLAQLGDEYETLRKAWIDNLLVDAGEELEAAGDGLRLARARELWRRATWYAERRDCARYGQKQELNVNVQGDWGERLRRAKARTIDATPLDVVSDAQIIGDVSASG